MLSISSLGCDFGSAGLDDGLLVFHGTPRHDTRNSARRRLWFVILCRDFACVCLGEEGREGVSEECSETQRRMGSGWSHLVFCGVALEQALPHRATTKMSLHRVFCGIVHRQAENSILMLVSCEYLCKCWPEYWYGKYSML